MDLRHRYNLLDKAKDDPELRAACLEMSRRDPVFWINHFGFTFDPRKNPTTIPFNLYPFQEEHLRKWAEHIADGEDFGIEKSRDMGCSWLIALLFQWGWQFKTGWNFHIGSRKEDFVDAKGDISTLFEKIRFNLRYQPHWMRPEGFIKRQHDSRMRLLNPENGNVITGESSNPDFSRSGRYKAILFDEFAFWPWADPAWQAASESSPCRIALSTTNGKGSKWYKVLHGEEGTVKHVYRLHWRIHPEKDDAWYEAKKDGMTRLEVAQELDIDHETALGGRVVYDWSFANVDEGITYDPDRRLYLTCDFNVDPMCWGLSHITVGAGREKNYGFFDELAIEDTTIIETARKFADKYNKHKAGIIITGDASGNQRSDMSDKPNQTRYELLLRTLSDFGCTKVALDVPRANPSKEKRREQFNLAVCNANGTRRVKVHPNCKQIIRCLENLRYIPGTDQIYEPTPKMVEKDRQQKWLRQDMYDAISYLVSRYEPGIEAPTAKRKQPRTQVYRA